MCLISVVLPAPLAPTRPKTMPRGNVRLTLSRAVVEPNWRDSDRISTISVLTDSPLLGARKSLHGLVALAHELDNLAHADAELAGFSQQRVDALVEDFDALAPRQRRAGIRHERAGGPPLDDDAGRLQFTVGASDGVWIDQQSFRQDADRRHLLARRKPAGRHQVFHLVHDLQIDRHAVIG